MRRYYLIAAIAAFLITGSLMAEKRIYRAPQPVGTFIPALIDAMGNAGLKFKVHQTYDEKTDGKLGLLLSLKPGQRLVDLGIHDKNGKSTLVTVTFQDPGDSGVFNRLFTQNLNMTEVGLGKVDGNVPSGWPAP